MRIDSLQGDVHRGFELAKSERDLDTAEIRHVDVKEAGEPSQSRDERT